MSAANLDLQLPVSTEWAGTFFGRSKQRGNINRSLISPNRLLLTTCARLLTS